MKRIISLFLISIFIFSCTYILNVHAVSGQEIVNEALKWLEANSPYGPADGSGGYGSTVDCSGLVMQVYKKFGFSLGRTTDSQATVGRYVAKEYLQPGDIVCMSYPAGNIGHVGIYVGNDRMIHAPGTGRYVQYGNNISEWTYANGGCKLEYGRRLIDDEVWSPSSDKPYISNVSQAVSVEETDSKFSITALELQRCLNYIMDAGLVEDGFYGAKTAAAVKNFQNKYGLEADGVAGSQTLKKVNEIMDEIVFDGYEVDNNLLKFKIGDDRMYVNGAYQEIDPGRYASPVIENGRTLLPVRAVTEAFGAEVLWDGQNNIVTILFGENEMKFWINSSKAVVNGVEFIMDASPVLINGRTYMPLRFVAEQMGLNVEWNSNDQTITVAG